MSSFTAQVKVEGGMLHTSRPLTAPEQVADLIESVVYNMRESAGGDVVSIDLTIETSGDTGTPIGDSVSGTSSTPLPGADGGGVEPPDLTTDVPADVPADTPATSA